LIFTEEPGKKSLGSNYVSTHIKRGIKAMSDREKHKGIKFCPELSRVEANNKPSNPTGRGVLMKTSFAVRERKYERIVASQAKDAG